MSGSGPVERPDEIGHEVVAGEILHAGRDLGRVGRRMGKRRGWREGRGRSVQRDCAGDGAST